MVGMLHTRPAGHRAGAGCWDSWVANGRPVDYCDYLRTQRRQVLASATDFAAFACGAFAMRPAKRCSGWQMICTSGFVAPRKSALP